jgi:hypothetical protein
MTPIEASIRHQEENRPFGHRHGCIILSNHVVSCKCGLFFVPKRLAHLYQGPQYPKVEIVEEE